MILMPKRLISGLVDFASLQIRPGFVGPEAYIIWGWEGIFMKQNIKIKVKKLSVKVFI